MISGTKLRKVRDKNKLSQSEVADAVGVHQSTYSDWESEKSQPHFKYWTKLADILKVELTELLLDGTSFVPNKTDTIVDNLSSHSNVSYLVDILYKIKDSESQLWSMFCNHLKNELEELKKENKKLIEENYSLKVTNEQKQDICMRINA